MLKSFLTRATCAVAFAASLSFPAVAAVSSFSQVIAFGDSLSDTGNLLARTLLVGDPFPPTPQSPDYYQGRFSNGPVAVEMVAAGLGVGLQNYAFGGATTTTDNGPIPAGSGAPDFLVKTGLQSQLGMYGDDLASQGTPGVADSSALYFIWAGANDIRYANPKTPEVIAATAATAIGNLASSVQTLYAMGARSFLLPNLPDLGITPEGLDQTPQVSALFTQVSEQFNAGLSGAYNQLSALPGIRLIQFNTLQAQRDLVAGMPGNGFSNAEDACFSGSAGSPGGVQCADVTGYVFWDSVHPTTATHQVLANQMLAQIAAVPEPESMFMLLAGGLLVFGVARRRRAA